MSRDFSLPFDIGEKIYYISTMGKPIKCDSCGRARHETVFQMRIGIVESISINHDKRDTFISYRVFSPGVENIYSDDGVDYVDSEDAFISEASCLTAMQERERISVVGVIEV